MPALMRVDILALRLSDLTTVKRFFGLRYISARILQLTSGRSVNVQTLKFFAEVEDDMRRQRDGVEEERDENNGRNHPSRNYIHILCLLLIIYLIISRYRVNTNRSH